MKYLFTLLFLLFASLQYCSSQEAEADNNPARIHISKERTDSLVRKIPPAKGFVNDFTNLFTADEIKLLDSLG